MDPDFRRLLDDLDRDRFRANMDDHFDGYMREQAVRATEPEAIRRAIWDVSTTRTDGTQPSP